MISNCAPVVPGVPEDEVALASAEQTIGEKLSQKVRMAQTIEATDNVVEHHLCSDDFAFRGAGMY
jgi:hypothetical protein